MPKGPSRTLVGVLRDDSGQAMLEYIIIVAVVVLAGLAVFKMIANYMKERSISIASVLNES